MTSGDIITISIFLVTMLISGLVNFWKSKQTSNETVAKIESTVTTETAVIRTRLDYLEKKQDKHNNLQERMACAEQSMKSAHHRIDEVCDRIELFRKEGKEG